MKSAVPTAGFAGGFLYGRAGLPLSSPCHLHPLISGEPRSLRLPRIVPWPVYCSALGGGAVGRKSDQITFWVIHAVVENNWNRACSRDRRCRTVDQQYALSPLNRKNARHFSV